MHGEVDASRGPRTVIAAANVVGAGLASWLIFRDGVTPRDVALLVCAWVYVIRLFLTSFVLLRRGVGWSEAAQVGSFVLFLQGFLGFLGSRSGVPWRALDWIGVVAYVLGSYLNTGSELQRKLWKARPENKGHLYTQGLFSLSMHVNYFGDVVLFSGFALLTTSPWAFLLPVVMAAGFVFAHIPMLDGYLAKRYGDEFTQWASRTKKLVPFVY